ncbi:hypothetical protein Acid7E03_05610 [Acidisoma sp. 7E03]
MTLQELPFGPIGARCYHLCIDMQIVFAGETEWHTPWMGRIRPIVHRLASYRPDRTIFTRFVPPAAAQDLPGTWRRYYDRWADLVAEGQKQRQFELLPELRDLCPPATVIDKLTYSPWVEPTLADCLREAQADTLIISGA